VVLVAGSGFETDAAGVSVLLKYVLGFAAEGESTKS
jgi:hypothetical protein